MNNLPKHTTQFQITGPAVLEIYNNLKRYDRLFPEDAGVFKSIEDFTTRLIDGKTVGLEATHGLIMLNEIDPGLSGRLHVTFWDGVLSERTELIKDCINWFFLNLDLQRIEVYVPEFAKAYRRFIEKKLLFRFEGRLRNALRYQQGYCDLFIYSCLRGEGV